MLHSKAAEKLQNEIYQKMPAEEKLKIAGQLFLFGRKLNQLKNINDSRKTAIKNRQDFRKS